LKDVSVLREAGLALLCAIDGKHVWVPRAQIVNGDVPRVGMRGVIVVPRWFAKDSGVLG
jgi:hypothetical protein